MADNEMRCLKKMQSFSFLLLGTSFHFWLFILRCSYRGNLNTIIGKKGSLVNLSKSRGYHNDNYSKWINLISIFSEGLDLFSKYSM